jgi:hypothetical protein
MPAAPFAPESPPSVRVDALALVALLVLHLLFFQRILFGGETLYFDDFSRYQLPLRALVAEAYGEGQIPLWNPYLWLGTPLAANPAAQAFYPLALPFLGMDDVTAVNLTVLLHLYLGGFFTYLLARDRVGSGVPALVAAVGFSLGGIALSYLVSPIYLCSLAWLPAVFLCFRRALSGRPLRHGVLAGASLALMVLAGDVQLPVIAGLVLVLLGIAAVGLAPPGARLATGGRALAALAVAAGVGAVLAAVQLLPTLELAGLSERAGGLEASARQSFSFHPARLSTLAVPYLFGLPLPENSYWGFHLGDGPRFWFFSIYPGALLLVLALGALRRSDPWSLGLAAALVTLTCLAFGRHGPFYEPAAQAIPGLDQFRYPEKFLAPLAVIVPVLGAEGLSRLSRGEARARILVMTLVLALGGGVLWALQSHLEEAFSEFFPVPFLIDAASARIAGDARNLLVFALGAALTLVGAWRGLWGPRAAVVALAAFASADLAVAGARLVWTEPAEHLREAPAVTSRLTRERTGVPPRLLRLPALNEVPLHQTSEDWRDAWAYLRAGLAPNQNVRWKIAALQGYGAGCPVEVVPVFGAFEDREAPALARILATPWVIAPQGDSPPWPQIGILRIPDALPRARLAGAELGRATLRRARGLVLGKRDFGRRALVEAGDALLGGEPLGQSEAQALAQELPPEGAGTARITHFRPQEVILEVDAARPSLLVLAEAFFPGWRATVGSSEVPIFRADLLGRAVAVPKGRQVVRFWFESPAVVLGARLSLAGLALLVSAGIFFSWRRRRGRKGPAPV